MAMNTDIRTSAQQFLRSMLSRMNLTLGDWYAYRNYSGHLFDDLDDLDGPGGPQRADACGDGMRWLRDSYRPVHGYLALAICLFGFVANVLNIVVLTRKEMRSSTNAILTGLAVADGSVMLEYMPFAVHNYVRVSSNTFSYWSARYVLFHAHFAQIFHTVSIFMTVMLAMWRYLLIVEPSAAVRRCTVRRTVAVIVAVYAISPLICVPSYFTFSVQSRSAGAGAEPLYIIDISDIARRHHGLLNRMNFWLYSVLIKLAPCLALTYFSLRLIAVLLETRRRKRRLLAAGTSPAPRGRNVTSSLAQGVRHTDRTTSLLVVVLLLFLLTELPQAALAMLSGVLQEHFFRTCYQHVGELLDILALTNSAVNFVLYCMMCKQFRATFWALIGCPRDCHRPPQQILLNSHVISLPKQVAVKTTLV
ncbi:G-protein coupled receptor dmsr-1-like [Amphibalanus amphitrite]|nr:G-protein coupled receptor dmsr-1-like [Amphibalanus amphitrite]